MPLRQRVLANPLYLHLRQVVRGDPVARLALLVFAGCLIAWLGGLVLGGGWQTVGNSVYYLLLLLTLFALRWRLPFVDSRERPFWNDLTAVYLAWVGQSLLYLLPLPHTLRFYLAAELMLAAGYVAWILVLERQPHRRQRLRPKALERALAWPAAMLFVVGLLAYFVLIPMFSHRDEYLRFHSSMLLYLTLDVYIALRLLHQVQITRSRHWQAIYSILMVAAVCMFAVDVVEFLALAGWIDGDPISPLYGLQWLALILAAAMRHQTLVGDDPAEDPATASMAAPSLHTMISAVSLPLIHFAGYRLGLLDDATLNLREWVVGLWIVLLGCFALVQHWLLVDRARLLWVDWAKADKALRRSEQKARVVSERLRAKKALKVSQERFDIAFHASPTPSAILSLTLGRFREINVAFAQLLGYRKHQLLDQTPVALNLWWSHRDAVLFRRRIRGRSRLEDFTTHLRTARGDRLETRLSAELLEIENKACLLVVVHAEPGKLPRREVPDLQRAQQAIYAVDRRDRIVLWNDAASRRLGWRAEEVQRCYAGEILAPTGDTTDLGLLHRQRWRSQKGRRMTMLASVTPLLGLPHDADESGRLIVGHPMPRAPRQDLEDGGS